MPSRRSKRPAAPPDSVLTIDELSVYLKIAKSTAYKLAQEGKLPGQKVGRHWRFHREAVDRWLFERANSDSGRNDRGDLT